MAGGSWRGNRGHSPLRCEAIEPPITHLTKLRRSRAARTPSSSLAAWVGVYREARSQRHAWRSIECSVVRNWGQGAGHAFAIDSRRTILFGGAARFTQSSRGASHGDWLETGPPSTAALFLSSRCPMWRGTWRPQDECTIHTGTRSRRIVGTSFGANRLNLQSQW